jgi:hypothetical protein
MRKTRPFSSALIGASAAVIVVVALPGIGLGETSTSHGGTPTDVYTSTEPGICSGEEPVGTEPAALLPTAVQVTEASDVIAYFTSTWSTSGSPTSLLMTLQIEGEDFLETSPQWIANTATGGSERNAHDVGTVMWAFHDVAAGDYAVEATASIAGFPGTNTSGANLQACALTVFVVPPA